MTNASQNSSNKIKIKCVISALIQLGCLMGLLYFAGNSISTYCQYDTRALIKIKNSSDETYIAFTICPKLEDFNSDTLSSYGINAHRYIWQGNFTGNSSGENAWDIFQKVTYNLENLIRTLYLKTKSSEYQWIYLIKAPLSIKIGSGKTRRANRTWNDETSGWYELTEKYSLDMGRCFEFKLNEKLINKGLKEVTFESQTGRAFNIFVHAPGQFHNMGQSRVQGMTNLAVVAGLSSTVQVDSLEEESKMPCKSEMNQQLDNCLYKQAAEKLMQRFNCVLPFLPPNKTQPVCEKQSGSPRYHEKRSCYEEAMSNEHWGLCNMPCKMMESTLEIYEREEQKSNRSCIKIYFKTSATVQVTEIIRDYPFTSLLAGKSHTELERRSKQYHQIRLYDQLFDN